MRTSPEDLADAYRTMGDGELLNLGQSYESLTPAAQAALRAEFGNRKLDAPILEDAEMLDARHWITVRRFRDLSEAIVARSMLESAGIAVYLRDENLVRLDWQVSNFIGGIRLQVEPLDEHAAIDLLDQPIPPTIAFNPLDEFTQPHCPRCRSIDITFEGSSRAAALAAVHMLSIPLPLGRESWLCQACGARWEEIEEQPAASSDETAFPE